MAPTLEEVAKLANVSRSTVSRVINDNPNVREETRERVWQAIRQVEYQPHAVARSLATSRTRTIGVIIPETVTALFTDPFYPLLLRGVAESCNIQQYRLLLSLFSAPTSQKELYQQALRNGYVDGVIVAAAPPDDPIFADLRRDRIPMIFIGRHPDQEVHYVDCDNVGGAQMAVEHLIRLGHRRIGTITGRIDMTAGQDRLNGYRQALQAHGIPVRDELIIQGDYSERSGSLGMQRLLPASPDAVFTASDTMAIGALKALRQTGLRVPEDIALIGFDDTPAASLVDPPLTTVRQPIERMGALAVNLLLSMLESGLERATSNEMTAHRIILPTELIVRESCGATF